ncbi:RNA polymerase sigma factor [Sulfurifustis variabilis]|uniref:RNA polymerase sigma factor n=1 Tax=Sulfurifustis variabilis TaxID=1675686 RepID=A0A1B4VBC7_9GAMM|nr:sigma-70 family RNA polymerase sigma factor [Sulfurifustis variabilis]BAU47811.1 RNA polymerase sigma factor [Sulfurifustis variabilis]
MANRQAQFEALVQAYSADLYRFAFWLCRSRTVAEDLVQETYLRAWRALANLRSGDSAKGWLLTILRNEHARLRQRQRHEAPLDEPEMLEEIPDDKPPDDEAWLLRRALARLPEEYREPLLLQVIGGFSAQEIGKIIDASAPAVLTRLFRARQKLRAELIRESGADAGAGRKTS